MKRNLLITSALASLALVACGETRTENTSKSPKDGETLLVTTVQPEAALGSFGISTEHIDESVAPGEDFNRHVNGKWLDSFEIPADKRRYGMFTVLSDQAEKDVKKIISDMAEEGKSEPEGSVKRRIGDFYNAYMNQEAIDATSDANILTMMQRIKAISSREDLAAAFGETGISAPFGGWVDIDSKQVDRYIFYVTQAGLGMPDRDYYLKPEDKYVEFREKYVAFLADMLTRAGYEDADAKAVDVMALETELAEIHWERAKRRNRDITYNLHTRVELETLAGGFPIGTTLDELGLGEQDAFVIRETDALEGSFKLANEYGLDAWKAYLAAHFMMDNASVLHSDIDAARFEFFGKTLSGQPEQRERWKRAVRAVEGTLGEAVGEVYVERHFPPRAKTEMDKLVENLRTAYGERIDGLSWMGDETKVQARDKLAKFKPKIGYPESFETYDGLEVTDSAYANAMSANDWQWQDMISKLGGPIDRDEWFMNPQTVNAYYSPNRNEIVFPAAILQPPFFDMNADPAVNYGAIGAVIGHEMGHGFDDQGSKSDGDGVLRNWWTEDDLAAFQERTAGLVAQYNEFSPIEGEHVNGELTLGENIGDLGGLTVAYHAYKLSLKGEEAPVIDGYTGDQRFFLSWAQVWRSLYREEATRQQLLSDPHSPPQYRINGVVRNMDAWYDAFDVKETDALYLPPEERIGIW